MPDFEHVKKYICGGLLDGTDCNEQENERLQDLIIAMMKQN